jgi:hypothetical protein
MGKMFPNASSLKPHKQLKPNCPGIIKKLGCLCRSEIQDDCHHIGGSHLGFPIGIKNRHFVQDLPMIILGQFGFICPSGFREETF